MKKAIFSTLIIGGVILLFCFCKKEKDQINEATEFSIDYSTTLPIPSSSVSTNVPVEFTTPDIPTTSTSRFAAEKTTKELIDEIKLTKFNISTNNGNLDFIKSLSISIQAAGLQALAVASKTLVPTGQTSISADLGDINIKDYIFKDNIQFKISVTVNTALGSDKELKLEQSIKVKGKKI
jgi:hypothetical protein